MIRTSAAIATVALAVSVTLHASGLGFVTRNQPNATVAEAKVEKIAVGNAFEDIAEAPSQPAEPDPAPVPERLIAPPTESPQAFEPTSRALVASENPQAVSSPDTGAATIPQLETVKPVETEGSGDGSAAADADPEQSRDPEPPVEAKLTEPVNAPAIAHAPPNQSLEQSAVSPVAAAQSLSVEPILDPNSMPATAVAPDAAIDLAAEAMIAPVPQEQDPGSTEDANRVSALVVDASPRPKPATRRPSAEKTRDLAGGQPAASSFDLSPQTTDQRLRADQASLGFGGEITDGIALLQSRRPGNSDVTNFAGRVLVHLNRTPTVDRALRGSAQVVFEINLDGTLAWAEVTVSSGSKQLDDAALEQVRISSPFPRPPHGARRTFSFVYRRS